MTLEAIIRSLIPSFARAAVARISAAFDLWLAALVAVQTDASPTSGEARCLPFHPCHELDLALDGERVPVTVQQVSIHVRQPEHYDAPPDQAPLP